MFRSDNDFFHRVPLTNAQNVASTSFFKDRADSAVKTLMRHSFLDARVNPDDHLISRLIFLK